MKAKYTEVLRNLIKNEETKKMLDAALSTYPLYVSKKPNSLIPTREELNRAILNHYRNREIGSETVGGFLEDLQYTMEEIMPYYNERFRTIDIMADIENPFDNVDIVEQYDEERSDTASGSGSGSSTTTTEGTDTTSASSQGETNSTSSGTNSQTASVESTSQGSESNEQTTSSNGSESNTHTTNGKQVESDTPQDSLTIGSKGIDNVSYASMAKWDETTGSGSASTENESSTNGTITRTGSEGSESSSSGTSSATGKDTTTASSQGEASHQSSGTATTQSETSSQSTSTITHTFKKKGNQGVNTFAHDIHEFRTKAIIDVKFEIINDKQLNECFMLVY